MKKIRNSIHLFEKADPTEPHDDFTRDVFRRIEARGERFSRSRWKLMGWHFFGGGLSGGNCFLRFVMVGVLYCIPSFILMFYFKNEALNICITRVTNVELSLAFFFALTFVLLGMILLKGGIKKLKVAKIIIILHIGLVVARGLALDAFIINLPLIPFVTVGFIVTGIAMGLFLVITLIKYERALV